MPKENDQVTEPENNDNEPTEEEQAAELYEAVSGAIDEVTITPEKTNNEDAENENADDDDGGTDTGDDTEVSTDGDTATDEVEGDGEESEEGSETDTDTDADDGDDGKTKSGDGTKEEDGADGAKPPEGDESTEELDPVNDPIPESTNEKTSTRIKSLIGIIKGKEGAEVQRDEILDQIESTGADAEQYAGTLGFLKLYNSTDINERKQALTFVRGLVKELALDLGEGASVVKLDDHDDLQAEVEAGTLTEARALEVAATRDAKTLQNSRDEVTRNKNDETSQTHKNIAIGRKQLDVVEATFRENKNYAKFRPAFIQRLKPVLQRTHPTDWGEAARELYDLVKLMPIAEAPKPKPKPKNEPLRPKGGTGGGGAEEEVGSAVDAVTNAIENM